MVYPVEEYQKMADAEERLWWYRTLHSHVLERLALSLSDKDDPIIDAACGTGGLMMALRGAGYTNVRGFDIAPFAVETCRRRGLAAFTGDLIHTETYFPANEAGAIVCNDALYFLADDAIGDALAQFRAILHPGGFVLANLPAFDCFAGTHDLCVGIGRRFSAEQIGTRVKAGKLELVDAFYWPFLVSPAIYLLRLAQRLKRRLRPGAPMESDVSVPPRLINDALWNLTRLERRMMRRPPFGSSLFVVWRRPT